MCENLGASYRSRRRRQAIIYEGL